MRRIKLTVLASLPVLAFAPLAAAQVLPPSQDVGGISQNEWSARWWTQVITSPASALPIIDTTGAVGARGDEAGSGVFFLYGSSSPAPVTRSVAVPEGRRLFFPIINAFADNTPYVGQPPTTFTEQELLDLVTSQQVTSQFLTIDGVPVANLFQQRQTRAFSYTVTNPDNFITLIGADPTFGTGMYPSTVSPVVSDGYWVMLDPLPVGTHTLHFGGSVASSGFAQDITYTITVPAPGAAGILAASALVAFRRRRA